jgi:hypothetical protein
MLERLSALTGEIEAARNGMTHNIRPNQSGFSDLAI